MEKSEQIKKIRQKFKYKKSKPKIKMNFRQNWFSEDNQTMLLKYIKKYCNKRKSIILELGTWMGRSAYFESKYITEDSIVICVDHWKGDISIGKEYKNEESDLLYKQFIINLWEYKEKVIPVRMDGDKAIKLLYEMGIKPDLIYLDMDHSYESVIVNLKNIHKYYSEVPLVGDDFYHYEGVKRAVMEHIINNKYKYLDIERNCYALIQKDEIDYTKRDILKELKYERYSRELIYKLNYYKKRVSDYKLNVIIVNEVEMENNNVKELLGDILDKLEIENKIQIIKRKDSLYKMFNNEINKMEKENKTNYIFIETKNIIKVMNIINMLTYKYKNCGIVLDLKNKNMVMHNPPLCYIYNKNNIESFINTHNDNEAVYTKLFYNEKSKNKKKLDVIILDRKEKKYIKLEEKHKTEKNYNKLKNEIRNAYKNID